MSLGASSPSPNRSWLAILLFGGVTSACGHDAAPANTQEFRCIEAVEVLPSLTAITPLGVSAQSILDFSVGARTDSMHWRNRALGGELEFAIAPETGVTQITTELLPVPGAPRWVRSTPEFPTGRPQDILECPDRLEIDVQLRVQTPSGALAEQVPAQLVATSPHAASIHYVSSDKAPHKGSLNIAQSTPPGVALRNIGINLSYTTSSHYGEIRGLAQLGKQIARVELGTWPSPAPTPRPSLIHNCLSSKGIFILPHGEVLLGYDAQKVSERISSANPILLSPLFGEKVTGSVGFALTQDRSCVSAIQEFPKVADRNQYAASGILELTIGSQRTQIPAVAVSTTDDRNITAVTVKSEWSSKYPLDGALTPEAFRAVYGDLGIRLEGHRFFAIFAKVRYESQLPGSGNPTRLAGGVQVLGITPTPRSASGAIVEVLGRWEFRG